MVRLAELLLGSQRDYITIVFLFYLDVGFISHSCFHIFHNLLISQFLLQFTRFTLYLIYVILYKYLLYNILCYIL